MAMLKIALSDDDLWDNITILPRELKEIIGSFSTCVRREKHKLKMVFFKEYNETNVDRVMDMIIKKWTKKQIIWVLQKCSINLRYSLFFYTKKLLVDSLLRSKLVYKPEFNVMFLRRRWQNLRLIEIVQETFEKRKRLALKQKRAEKKAGNIIA